jgi:ABC-2 type transport system ATP-binding protein
MPEGPAVRIEGLERRFGAIEAVRGISLEIQPGETFGLLGPNGAGKTTTLTMLATLVAPSGGDAQIFGRRLRRDVSAVKRCVGIAPQEISLYPDLSGEENLLFFGRIHGIRGDRTRRRAHRLLELVGLDARRHDRVRDYSGGMKRRLNLACALVHEPRLLLLDEPTAGVDPQSRARIFEAIREIARSGATVVYTTHYIEEAERLCDRIAIMDEGRIIAAGTREELLQIIGAGEVIELRGTDGIDLEPLRSIPEVREVERAHGITRIRVSDAARAIGPIAALFADRGAAGTGIKVYPVDLERVFMQLTGRALRD